MVNEQKLHGQELEGETLKSALRLLQDLTGISGRVQVRELLIAPGRTVDAVVSIQIAKLEIPIFVEIKDSVSSSSQVSHVIANKSLAVTWMLVARYIAPPICASLRAAQIGYIDLTGNIHLPIVISHQGHSRKEVAPESLHKAAYRPRLHTDSVMKLLFYFLADPKTLLYTQRQLSELVGVSPAAINKAIASLTEQDFLAQQSDGRKIIRRKRELIQRWSTSYSDDFRKQLYRGRFRRVSSESGEKWFRSVSLQGLSSVWGGEPAGAIYTHHLNPEHLTIYSRDPIQNVLHQLRLTPDDNGDVELLAAFWSPDLDRDKRMVPPLIAYADLLGSGYERNRETAEVLYEQNHLGD